MEYRYKPEGVCSKEMIITIEDTTVKSVEIVGGCAGNSGGISRLVEGMNLDEVIQKLKGVLCGYRGTSCPDQLAKGLEECKREQIREKRSNTEE